MGTMFLFDPEAKIRLVPVYKSPTEGNPSVLEITNAGTAVEVSLGDFINYISGELTPAPVAWDDVEDVPAALTAAQDAGTASIRALGTGATDAAAGDHDHAVAEDVDSGLAAAANIQDLAIALSTRIKALEDAAA